jgi:YD repeat-containing protein
MSTDAPWQLTAGPIEVIDPLGRRTTFNYCDPEVSLLPAEQGQCALGRGVLQYFVDPEDRRTNLAYDLVKHPGTVTRIAAPPAAGQPALPDLVTNEIYDCTQPLTCAHPSTIVDANGNTTHRTYSAVHGGLLTETLPAANGISPQTRYEYAHRQARLSDGAPAGSPIWLLVRERFCRTTAASGQTCAGGAADEVITDYDYGPDSGPNTLLLRGTIVSAFDNGATTVLRTCYGYDALGRRISETQPNANLSACP